MNLLRLPAIIGTLPVTLTNGTTADATQVMSDLNWIVNQVNANGADAALVALKASNNNFTAVQSGVAASAAAHFPIASQVQNSAFMTLSSTLGTNTISARIATLPLGAYAVGQIFTFIPSQRNTGSATLNIDSLGSAVIHSENLQLVGNELGSGAAVVRVASIGAMPVLDLVNPRLISQVANPGMAKVWAMVSATPTLDASYNVTSVADGGTGIVAVTIATDFSSANFAVIPAAGTAGYMATYTISNAGAFNVTTTAHDGIAADQPFSVACFGDQ